MSDYKTTIKSNVVTVELDKKEVKITCANNKSGKAVMTALTQNPSIFGGNIYDFKKGLTSKDFKVKFKKKDYAETFYDNVMSIVSDPSVKTTDPEKSGTGAINDKINEILNNMNGSQTAPAGNAAPANNTGSSDNTMLYVGIGGAVLLVVIIGLLVWKMKK